MDNPIINVLNAGFSTPQLWAFIFFATGLTFLCLSVTYFTVNASLLGGLGFGILFVLCLFVFIGILKEYAR